MKHPSYEIQCVHYYVGTKIYELKYHDLAKKTDVCVYAGSFSTLLSE